MTIRNRLANADDIVVKVGTKVLIGADGSVANEVLDRLVTSIARLRSRGCRVVLVSSGAVGIGASALGVSHQLVSVCAATGQSVLTSVYQQAFRSHSIHVGQILVTAEDFATPSRSRKLIQTLQHLIEAGALPILNENDAISGSQVESDSARAFSENDMLASLIARELHADLLVFLTDVDGVYDLHPEDPEAALISELQGEHVEANGESRNGRGGVRAKVKAAIHATRERHTVAVIANGRTPDVLERILSGDQIGTLVASVEVK
ncbi:MAG TPA: glutamate 5-kinase [Terriglobales bacterium]|nr:glutamate 5-kinase [Terriglobales bacterium]